MTRPQVLTRARDCAQLDAAQAAKAVRAFKKQRRELAQRERSIANMEQLIAGMGPGPERGRLEITLRDAKLSVATTRGNLGLAADSLAAEHAELEQA